MVVTRKDNLPDGVDHIVYYYYDRNGNDIEKIEDADIFRFNYYDSNGNRINEGMGYTRKYLEELSKDDPELLEELNELQNEENDSIKNNLL